MVWVAVEDLIFLSKIQETARRLSVPLRVVAPGQLPQALAEGRASAIVLDLGHPAAIEALRAIKNDPATRQVRVLGFVSHVETGLAQSARAAGCDTVLARSAFSRRLPELLRELATAAETADGLAPKGETRL
jgi:CheY-like chemotaxis protein